MPRNNNVEEQEVFLERTGPAPEEEEIILERAPKEGQEISREEPREPESQFGRILKMMGKGPAKAIENRIQMYGGGRVEEHKAWTPEFKEYLKKTQGHSPERIRELEEEDRSLADEATQLRPSARYRSLIGATEEELKPRNFLENWTERGSRALADIVLSPEKALISGSKYVLDMPLQLLKTKFASTLVGSAVANRTGKEWMGDLAEVGTDIGLSIRQNAVTQKVAADLENKLNNTEKDQWKIIDRGLKGERVPAGDAKMEFQRLKDNAKNVGLEDPKLFKYLDTVERSIDKKPKATALKTRRQFLKEVDPATGEAAFRDIPTGPGRQILEDAPSVDAKTISNNIKRANKQIYSDKTDSVTKDYYQQAKGFLYDMLDPLFKKKPEMKEAFNIARDMGQGLRNVSETMKHIKTFRNVNKASNTKQFMDYLAAHSIATGNIPAGLTTLGLKELQQRSSRWLQNTAAARQRVKDILEKSKEAQKLLDSFFEATAKANPSKGVNIAQQINKLINRALRD